MARNRLLTALTIAGALLVPPATAIAAEPSVSGGDQRVISCGWGFMNPAKVEGKIKTGISGTCDRFPSTVPLPRIVVVAQLAEKVGTAWVVRKTTRNEFLNVGSMDSLYTQVIVNCGPPISVAKWQATGRVRVYNGAGAVTYDQTRSAVTTEKVRC